jgi:hypothetical protein
VTGARRLVPGLLVPAVLVLGAPAPARASAEDVLRDCIRNGQLDGQYTRAELRRARRILPSDQDEYSTCRDVIDEALVISRPAPPKRPRDREDGSNAGVAPGEGSPPAPAAPPPPAPAEPAEPPPAPAAKAVKTPQERAEVAQATGEAPPTLRDLAPVTAADGRRPADAPARELPAPIVLLLLALVALAVAVATPALHRPLARARLALRRG